MIALTSRKPKEIWSPWLTSRTVGCWIACEKSVSWNSRTTLPSTSWTNTPKISNELSRRKRRSPKRLPGMRHCGSQSPSIYLFTGEYISRDVECGNNLTHVDSGWGVGPIQDSFSSQDYLSQIVGGARVRTPGQYSTKVKEKNTKTGKWDEEVTLGLFPDREQPPIKGVETRFTNECIHPVSASSLAAVSALTDDERSISMRGNVS